MGRFIDQYGYEGDEDKTFPQSAPAPTAAAPSFDSKRSFVDQFGYEDPEPVAPAPEKPKSFWEQTKDFVGSSVIDQLVGGYQDTRSSGAFETAVEKGQEAANIEKGRTNLQPNKVGFADFARPGAVAQGMTLEQRRALADKSRAEAKEALARSALFQKRGAELPASKETQDFLNENSGLSVWEAFKKAPAKIIVEIGARSGTAMVPGLVAGATLAAAAAPGGPVASGLGFATGMGAGSARMEYAGALQEALKNEGVNITDPDALAAATADDALMARVQKYATLRSATIGGIDAIAGLVGAKQLAPGITNKLARELANAGIQMPAQAGLGAAGEAGGQLASTGKITDTRSIAAEAAGEFITAPIDVATAAYSGTRADEATDTAPKPAQSPLDRLNEKATAARTETAARGGDALEQELAAARVALESQIEGAALGRELTQAGDALQQELAGSSDLIGIAKSKRESILAGRAYDEATAAAAQATAGEAEAEAVRQAAFDKIEADTANSLGGLQGERRASAFEMNETAAANQKERELFAAERQRQLDIANQGAAVEAANPPATTPTLADVMPAEARTLATRRAEIVAAKAAEQPAMPAVVAPEAAAETYLSGDRARYTGKTLDRPAQGKLPAWKMYEVEMLEGADKGKLRVVKNPPKQGVVEPSAALTAPEQDAADKATLMDRIENDPQLREDLTDLNTRTGWMDEGGRLLTKGDYETTIGGTLEVTGATSWNPRETWWKEKPAHVTVAYMDNAVKKALAGKRLTDKQHQAVKFLAMVAEDRRSPVDLDERPTIYTPEKLAEMDAKKVAAGINVAAQEAATSVENDLPQPTEAQIEAGNYRKGHINVAGVNISVENPVGSQRKFTRDDGSQGAATLKDHYGYIRGTEGADGDHVDAFINPDEWSSSDTPQENIEGASTGPVFVIDQINQETGAFDEHKVMLGYPNQMAATRAYLRNYSKGHKVGPVTELSDSEFKSWIKNGDHKAPMQPVRKGIRSAQTIEGERIETRDARPARKGIRGEPMARTEQPTVEKPEALTHGDALAVASPLFKEMPGLDVSIVPSFDDLPTARLNDLKRLGRDRFYRGSKGIYFPITGEIFLFSSKHKSADDLVESILHEGVAHHGLRALLGDEQFSQLMRQVYASLTPAQRVEGARLAGVLDDPVYAEVIADEHIAALAEKGDTSSLLQRIIDAVRDALRRAGIVKGWNSEDIKALLRESRRALQGKPLDQIKVVTEAEIAETGEVVDLEQRADIAIRQIKKRQDMVNKLKECMA